MIPASVLEDELGSVASKHKIARSYAIGLGAGLYFEYFRRPHLTPSHTVNGLARDFETVLMSRLPASLPEAEQKIRAAMRENALRFNLDRSPTTALLGMEMLAEELPHFDRNPDYRASLLGMSERICATRSLYRRDYQLFLDEVNLQFFSAAGYSDELREIADEWDTFGFYLKQTADSPSGLERASQLLRRLAFREEHFWGTILEGTAY